MKTARRHQKEQHLILICTVPDCVHAQLSRQRWGPVQPAESLSCPSSLDKPLSSPSPAAPALSPCRPVCFLSWPAWGLLQAFPPLGVALWIVPPPAPQGLGFPVTRSGKPLPPCAHRPSCSLLAPSFSSLLFSHIMSEYGRMTDTERDQIDQDAQIFMRTCSEAIQQLRVEGRVLSSHAFVK